MTTSIFLSRPTWVAPDFATGLDAFIRLLKSHGLEPRTLGTTDYPSKAPLDEVIDLMSECHGAIILGLPQIAISAGTVKDRAVTNLNLGTEWNHIEAALAYESKLPLLLVHHHNVSRGIFDRGTLNCFVYERDLADSSWPLATDLSGALFKWRAKVASGAELPIRMPVVESTSPQCPNCSTTRTRIYLSPLPGDFVKFENVSHECTTCGFKLPLAERSGT